MSHATMEKFRSCPICFEVPEKEIYQCSEGHLICSLCISKMNGKCPQCRKFYGPNKIRSRVLEEILDGQEFQCQFNGCLEFLKRGEITSHANTCRYNPDLLNLCPVGHFKDCEFKMGGCVPRSEIIRHFETSHQLELNIVTRNVEIYLPGKDMQQGFLSRKRRLSGSDPDLRSHMGIFSIDNSETSPLFLVFGKLDRTTGLISYVCVQLWGSPADPTRKYQVEFQLNKGETLSSSSSSPSSSSSSSTEENIISPPTMNVFPIYWTLQVCPLKDAENAIAESPMYIRISLLERHQFGVNKNDSLAIKFSQVN